MGVAERPSQSSGGMARVEVETTQDNVEDLSWEKDDDDILCGVLGVVETALGSSIRVLAVSGPNYATSDDDDDHNDSLQRAGELFALRSQVSQGRPDQEPDVPPCLGQQLGSANQQYQCATQLMTVDPQLNKTASATHNSMKGEVKPCLKKKKGGVTATCRFPPD